MSFKDYYKILEINSTATQADIKKSYRKLALKYHPDKNFGDKISEAKFKEIKEAYEILSVETRKQNFDYDYNKFYGSQTKQNTSQNYRSKDEQVHQEAPPVTPHTFLELFHQMHRKVFLSGSTKDLDKQKFYNRLKESLNEKCISFLNYHDDVKTNRQIIKELLQCCDLIETTQVKDLSTTLVKIAATDNETIQKIHDYIKERNRKDKKRSIIVLSLIFALILLFLYLNNLSSTNSSTDQSYLDNNSNRPYSGDLYPNARPQNLDTSMSNSIVQSVNPSEDYSDWDEKNYETGSSPGCYNFTPRYNKSLNNRLEISVGSHTDVALKLISFSTGKCIRYVFIRSGDVYNIKNIPQGKYYLKIAYGKDWRQKIINGKCVGKFVSNALYKKGDEILDFNKVYEGIQTEDNNSYKSYKVPSYSLKLDVSDTDFSDKFETDIISEDEFND